MTGSERVLALLVARGKEELRRLVKRGLTSRFAAGQWAVVEWVMAGKIRRESDYWDAATFVHQVGLLRSSKEIGT